MMVHGIIVMILKINTERKQIDFHQGFILTSLNNIYSNTNFLHNELHDAINKGLLFY